jgi:hypothetical protein
MGFATHVAVYYLMVVISIEAKVFCLLDVPTTLARKRSCAIEFTVFSP